jgi:hypothetical protein
MESNNIATSAFNLLTAEAKKFMIELMEWAGNGYHTATDMEYYLEDLYTDFEPSDMMDSYSKEAIGGFMKSLREKGLVVKSEGFYVTRLGVQVAILIAKELEATGTL